MKLRDFYSIPILDPFLVAEYLECPYEKPKCIISLYKEMVLGPIANLRWNRFGELETGPKM